MVDIGRVLSIFTISYAELTLIAQLSGRRTLGRRRGVEPLGILRLRGSAIALVRGLVALGDRWTHGVLVIGWPWRVRHGRLQQGLVVSPGLDKLLIQLRKVVCTS
jgi:hypothetical protein